MNALKADIPCPRSRKNFSVPLTEIGPGKSWSCPNCGEIIKFAGKDPGKILKAIDQLASQAGGASVMVTVRTKGHRPGGSFGVAKRR